MITIPVTIKVNHKIEFQGRFYQISEFQADHVICGKIYKITENPKDFFNFRYEDLPNYITTGQIILFETIYQLFVDNRTADCSEFPVDNPCSMFKSYQEALDYTKKWFGLKFLSIRSNEPQQIFGRIAEIKTL